MALDLRPPAGFVRRLRELAEDGTLAIELDEDETIQRGEAVWNLTTGGLGEARWLCDHHGPLDGALDAIAQQVRRLDRRRHDPAGYATAIQAKIRSRRASRRNQRMNTWRGIGDYMKAAFRRYIYEGSTRR